MHGLGFSWVGVTLPDLGIETRQFVLPCPTDDGRVQLRIAMQVREDYGRAPLPLRWLPRAWVTRLLLAVGVRNYRSDVQQDVPFWSTKAHLTAPGLAEGEAPIAQYRRWARQFYVDRASAVGPDAHLDTQRSA